MYHITKYCYTRSVDNVSHNYSIITSHNHNTVLSLDYLSYIFSITSETMYHLTAENLNVVFWHIKLGVMNVQFVSTPGTAQTTKTVFPSALLSFFFFFAMSFSLYYGFWCCTVSLNMVKILQSFFFF